MRIIHTFVATTVVALAGLGASAPRAEAGLEISIGVGFTFVSGRADCGCPIYSERVCRGFDRYQRPVFADYRVPFRCRGGHHIPPGHLKHGKHYDKHYKSKHHKPKSYNHKGKHPKKHKKKCH